MKQVFDTADLKWTREPATYKVGEDEICIVTDPHTDLWQRTYYRFRNDNAPVLQIETEEKIFLVCHENRFFWKPSSLRSVRNRYVS